MKTGDVNLDGFPDVLFSCNGRVFLLMNSGCGQGCPEGISLQPTAVQVHTCMIYTMIKLMISNSATSGYLH